MWIVTTIGFFSVVQKPGDGDLLTVRARVRADLEALRLRLADTDIDIRRDAGTDYAYRMRVDKTDLANAVARMTLEIDYTNFKNEVLRRQGYERESIYSRVWGVLLGLQQAFGHSEEERAVRPVFGHPGASSRKKG